MGGLCEVAGGWWGVAGGGLVGELGVVEVGVEAVVGEEVGVVAVFFDGAVVEDEDLVGFDDGGEAVGS